MTAQPPSQVPSYRNPAEDKDPNATSVKYGPPLKPRPKLFAFLCVLLVAWLVTIIVMRFTTVHRDPASPASQSIVK